MRYILFQLFFLVLTGGAIEGAPVSTTSNASNLNSMLYELRNHEASLKTLGEQVENQEAIVDSLRKQVNDQVQGLKDLVKTSNSDVDTKFIVFEAAQKNIVSDLLQIKNHLNELKELVASLQQKQAAQEKSFDVATKNQQHLESVLKTLMDLQTKEIAGSGEEVAITTSGKSYQVKVGDSLGKIAKENKTTVKAIKELNQLTQDKIVVGQTLLLP